MEDILVPIAFFVMVVLIIWAVTHHKEKAKEQSAQVIKAMIDKGNDVTPELIRSIGFTPKRRHADLRSGLIAMAIGLAFLLLGQTIPDDEAPAIVGGVASFPILIGLALIVFWYFISRKDED